MLGVVGDLTERGPPALPLRLVPGIDLPQGDPYLAKLLVLTMMEMMYVFSMLLNAGFVTVLTIRDLRVGGFISIDCSGSRSHALFRMRIICGGVRPVRFFPLGAAASVSCLVR